MSSRAALRVAEQTGCLPAEAAATLEVEPDITRATEALRAVMQARRSLYLPRLADVWAVYAGSPTAPETSLSGTIRFVLDLGLQLEDVVVLAVMYELQAPRVGVLAHAGFIDGWARLEAPTVADMRDRAVLELAARLTADLGYFRHIYRFTLAFNLEEGARMLALDTAVAYWELLLVPRYPIASKWVAYMRLPAQAASVKQGVGADTWNMVLELCEFVTNSDPELEKYDDTKAWPMLIDDFVEWIRSNR